MKPKQSKKTGKTKLVHARNAAILGVLAKSSTSEADREAYLSIVDPSLKKLAKETINRTRRVPVVKRTKDPAHLLVMSHTSSTPTERKRHLWLLSPRAKALGKRILARHRKIQAIKRETQAQT